MSNWFSFVSTHSVFIVLLAILSFGENFDSVNGNTGRMPMAPASSSYDGKDNSASSELLEQLYDAIVRNEMRPESQSDEAYDSDEVYGKRAIPYSGGMYGKRGKVPFSGGLYGKRAVPFSGGMYGKKSIPFSGGMYGKRSSSIHTGGKKSIPFSGGMYG